MMTIFFFIRVPYPNDGNSLFVYRLFDRNAAASGATERF
jgi:hypothetical protein